MAVAKNYFLPTKYKQNKVNITLDKDDSFYWDPQRVQRSEWHQFAVYQWAEELIKSNKFKQIADVGCGFAAKLAWLNKRLSGCNIWAIDQPHAIELCEKHYSFGHWLGVDLESNPASPPEKADLIISSDVIEHLENPDILLDYFSKIIALNGMILISTPERDLIRGKNCLHSPNKFHIREWNKDELIQYVQSKGFEVIEHRNLQAIRPSFTPFYIRKFITRLKQGKNMRYNQALLMKVRKD